jgi:hypothetical protein
MLAPPRRRWSRRRGFLFLDNLATICMLSSTDVRTGGRIVMATKVLGGEALGQALRRRERGPAVDGHE